MNKTIVGICTLIELGCISGLAYIGFKRNNDAYKAEMKAIDAEHRLFVAEINAYSKDREIEELKKELDKLKSQKEES